MQYSKAALPPNQDVDRRGLLSSTAREGLGKLPYDFFGTSVLGSNVNAPTQVASPWSSCGKVQRNKSEPGSVRGATKLVFFNKEVLGSEGTADQFWQTGANN